MLAVPVIALRLALKCSLPSTRASSTDLHLRHLHRTVAGALPTVMAASITRMPKVPPEEVSVPRVKAKPLGLPVSSMLMAAAVGLVIVVAPVTAISKPPTGVPMRTPCEELAVELRLAKVAFWGSSTSDRSRAAPLLALSVLLVPAILSLPPVAENAWDDEALVVASTPSSKSTVEAAWLLSRCTSGSPDPPPVRFTPARVTVPVALCVLISRPSVLLLERSLAASKAMVPALLRWPVPCRR